MDQKANGKGRFIDVSLLESTLACMGWVVSNHLNAGILPEPMGNENFTAAPSGTFKTKTGPLNISANEQKQFEKLCDLIDRPDLKTDVRFAERHTRKRHRAALSDELNRALAARPAEEWETVFNAAGVPAGCVLTVQEALQTDQIRARQFVEDLPLSAASDQKLRVTRPGFILDEAFPPPGPPPVLGAETRHWLGHVGCTPPEIDSLIERGIVHSAS